MENTRPISWSEQDIADDDLIKSASAVRLEDVPLTGMLRSDFGRDKASVIRRSVVGRKKPTREGLRNSLLKSLEESELMVLAGSFSVNGDTEFMEDKNGNTPPPPRPPKPVALALSGTDSHAASRSDCVPSITSPPNGPVLRDDQRRKDTSFNYSMENGFPGRRKPTRNKSQSVRQERTTPDMSPKRTPNIFSGQEHNMLPALSGCPLIARSTSLRYRAIHEDSHRLLRLDESSGHLPNAGPAEHKVPAANTNPVVVNDMDEPSFYARYADIFNSSSENHLIKKVSRLKPLKHEETLTSPTKEAKTNDLFVQAQPVLFVDESESLSKDLVANSVSPSGKGDSSPSIPSHAKISSYTEEASVPAWAGDLRKPIVTESAAVYAHNGNVHDVTPWQPKLRKMEQSHFSTVSQTVPVHETKAMLDTGTELYSAQPSAPKKVFGSPEHVLKDGHINLTRRMPTLPSSNSPVSELPHLAISRRHAQIEGKAGSSVAKSSLLYETKATPERRLQKVTELSEGLKPMTVKAHYVKEGSSERTVPSARHPPVTRGDVTVEPHSEIVAPLTEALSHSAVQRESLESRNLSAGRGLHNATVSSSRIAVVVPQFSPLNSKLHSDGSSQTVTRRRYLGEQNARHTLNRYSSVDLPVHAPAGPETEKENNVEPFWKNDVKLSSRRSSTDSIKEGQTSAQEPEFVRLFRERQARLKKLGLAEAE